MQLRFARRQQRPARETAPAYRVTNYPQGELVERTRQVQLARQRRAAHEVRACQDWRGAFNTVRLEIMGAIDDGAEVVSDAG